MHFHGCLYINLLVDQASSCMSFHLSNWPCLDNITSMVIYSNPIYSRVGWRESQATSISPLIWMIIIRWLWSNTDSSKSCTKTLVVWIKTLVFCSWLAWPKVKSFFTLMDCVYTFVLLQQFTFACCVCCHIITSELCLCPEWWLSDERTDMSVCLPMFWQTHCWSEHRILW